MKKTLCVLLGLAAMATSFVSCGGGKGSANKDVNLTVWCWDPAFNIFSMNEAAKIYKASHPNVNVNVVETPWADLQQKLITSLSANDTSSLPDIILCQDNAIQKNMQNYPKAFYPLDGKVKLDEFAGFKVGYGEMNGKHYSVPFDNGATATFLRKDIIEQAGLKVEDFDNITWSRFIELGKIVKAKTGKALISYVGNEPDCIMIMLQSCGKWLFDDNGNPYLANNDVLKKCVSLYAQMIKEGVCITVTDWNAYVATINNGTVASTINGCWIVGTISTQPDQKGKWAVVSTPKVDGVSSAVNYSSQGGSSWMVMSHSKNADVAANFLSETFGGSLDLYTTILPSAGAIATWLPAASSPAYDEPNAFFGGDKIYKKIVEYSGHIPQIKAGVFNYEARDAIGVAMAGILNGSLTVDSGLAEAQKNVEFLMGY